MVVQERAPALRRRLAATHHVFADGALADIDAEFEPLAILNPDAEWPLCATERPDILGGHLESMVAEVRDDAIERPGSGRPWGALRRRENKGSWRRSEL